MQSGGVSLSGSPFSDGRDLWVVLLGSSDCKRAAALLYKESAVDDRVNPGRHGDLDVDTFF